MGNRTAQVAEAILDRVIEGALPPSSELPPEADLAVELDVSRSTLREALKLLQSQGVVRAVHGKRGVVNPTSQWTALEPLVRQVEHRLGAREASLQLVEMRRIIEVGAASLAAQRRTEQDCEDLELHLSGLVEAQQAGDMEAFVAADIAFHDTILRAAGNEFVRLVFDPFHELLLGRRRETSAHPQVQENANRWHRALEEAIRAGDATAARDAMTGHMDQTLRDLRDLVLPVV